MRSKLILLGVSIIMAMAFLCGCQEQAVTTEQQFENISLYQSVDSPLVELVEASMTPQYGFLFEEDMAEPIEVVEKIEVIYRLHNIAGRELNLSRTIEFYDEYDSLVATLEDVPLRNFPSDYIESMDNRILLAGEQANYAKYIKIKVREIE